MSESGYPGFTGCCWMIVFGKWGFFLSESGFSGFKDLQDVIEILFLGSGDFFV